MSEIQLSKQLVDEVKTAIAGHDAQAAEDIIALQYLAAISGFILGNTPYQPAQKQELLEQLNAFSKHVLDDMERQRPPPQQEAFGIWKPGDS